ncbi:glycosyltransferase family 4 protein [Butyrivibrio sp. AC2005]|uniref:glycosyltransferase family 4 protein n=1 Tax=Butyrivibrio sp. AC2005 TaxID=1280672 RepID=UPI0003FF7940|nr:glycosyltransferase family 1 protein [Butyrivibrio sp. AC2005]
MKKHPLILNGKIFTQRVTGVQRYGIEIIKQIDKLVQPGEVILAVPRDELKTRIELKNIKTEIVGKRNGNLWTQIDLPLFAYKRSGEILTLGGIAPVIKPDYVTAHDISFVRYPESYNKIFRLMYRLGYRLTLPGSKRIITVSEFSKNELMSYYKLEEKKFVIAGNSAEHILSKEETGIYIDEQEVLLRLGLDPDERYYLSVGSTNFHKNQDFISKLAKLHPERKFVVAGCSSSKSFENDYLNHDKKRDSHKEKRHDEVLQDSNFPNLIYTGYISDNELRVLYKNARAFIFPSLYEGFGIPPLEAIAMGVTRIALADIPALREIYSEGCLFFDPYASEKFDFDKLERESFNSDSKQRIVKNDQIKETDTDLRDYYMNKYTWQKSAINILEAIR